MWINPLPFKLFHERRYFKAILCLLVKVRLSSGYLCRYGIAWHQYLFWNIKPWLCLTKIPEISFNLFTWKYTNFTTLLQCMLIIMIMTVKTDVPFNFTRGRRYWVSLRIFTNVGTAQGFYSFLHDIIKDFDCLGEWGWKWYSYSMIAKYQ